MNKAVRWIKKIPKLQFLALLIPVCLIAAEASTRVVVVYPEIREPYLKIFTDIISGVRQGFSGRVESYGLGKAWEPENLSETLTASKPDVILALGARSQQAVSDVQMDIPVLLGAVSTSGEARFPGISLNPDSGVYLEKLSLLAPKVSKVVVIYRPTVFADQVDKARIASEKMGLELKTVEISGLREAAEAFRKIEKNDLNRKTALWLADPGIIDSSLLSYILEVAWKKNIVVFSSNPAHVKRGVLFAVYPDNYAMGVSLGRLANHLVKGRFENPVLMPLRDVALAVNARTGDHLGLRIDSNLRREINLLFAVD